MKKYNLYFGKINLNYDIEFVRYLIVACCIAFCNLFFFQDEIFSLFYVLIEIGILIWFFLKKNYLTYLCLYTMFMSLSLEYPGYYGVEEVYGFKGTQILGVSVGTWMLLPLTFLMFCNCCKKINYKSNSKLIIVYKIFMFLFVSSIIFGIFNLIVNDNKWLEYGEVSKVFINLIADNIILLILPLSIYTLFALCFDAFIPKMNKALTATLIAIVIMQISSQFFNVTGISWDSLVLIAPMVAIFSPYLLLFCFYKEKLGLIYSKKFFLLGIITSVFAFKYPFGSGALLILFVMLVFFVILLVKSNKGKSIIYFTIIVGIGCFIGIFLYKPEKLSILLEYKLMQAVEVLKFWENDWWESMPNSAKVRFVEFCDILLEYLHKPWFFLFGKGIIGSFPDHIGFIESMKSTWGTGEGAYKLVEWERGYFFSVHETINVLFLSNGITGLLSVGYIIWISLKNIMSSPFILIGLMYLVFYYAYSFTLSFFGIACLVLGLAVIDKKVSREGA